MDGFTWRMKDSHQVTENLIKYTFYSQSEIPGVKLIFTFFIITGKKVKGFPWQPFQSDLIFVGKAGGAYNRE